MWFKQIQVLEFNQATPFSLQSLIKNLESLAFRPCLPSMETSVGWVSPLDTDEENAPLIRSMNEYIMICLQIEEKILPATVIRHELHQKLKKISREENRKIYQNEKLTIKDEIKITLLPRAFTKFTKVHAYIDTTSRRILLGTTSPRKTEQFVNLLKKSIHGDIFPLDIPKLSPMITLWLKNNNYPTHFSIEKSGVLQDPNQESRIIRCHQQDLFASSILSLIKDGCEVKQLAMNWQDRVSFTLSDDLSLKSIKFQDEIKDQANEIEAETKEQQFDADFLIMTETISNLLKDLFELLKIKSRTEKISSPLLEDAFV
jgi:recombination associated protein RdgC